MLLSALAVPTGIEQRYFLCAVRLKDRAIKYVLSVAHFCGNDGDGYNKPF
jgi:hypothetical protein